MNEQNNDLSNEFCCVNAEVVARIISSQNEAESCEMADFFKVFGDSSRIRILYALLNQEICVGDLVTALGMSQSAVSHQLRVLRQSGLVKYRKEGKAVIYSLDDEHVSEILTQGRNHLQHM